KVKKGRCFMAQNLHQLEYDIINAVKSSDIDAFKEITDDMQAYDLAQIYMELSDTEQDGFRNLATFQQQADILAELDENYQNDFLFRLDTESTPQVIQHMSNDDLISLLTHMHAKEAETLLKNTDKDFSQV